MKIKLFVAREIQYFELGIFSFNSYVYYLTRSFIASIRACNLATRAFNLATRASSLLTREFELVTRGSELVIRGFELVTRNSRFTFPRCLCSHRFKHSFREWLNPLRNPHLTLSWAKLEKVTVVC